MAARIPCACGLVQPFGDGLGAPLATFPFMWFVTLDAFFVFVTSMHSFFVVSMATFLHAVFIICDTTRHATIV